MRDITLGQYYPSDSILHRLDPRVKFIGTLVFIVSLFLVQGPVGYLFITAALLTIILFSRVPLRYVFGGLKAIVIILVITMAFNLFLTPGKVLCHFWIFTITEEGVHIAVRMGIRLMYLVIGSSIMTLTTTPNQLTDAMENLFGPLKYIRIPVHEIAMMMSIALRFIPILMEETDKIKKAQMARGADFESGNFITRIRSMVPLLVPLFVSAFRRANDLAMAMEARCYHGGESRTQMKPLRFVRRDALAFLIMFSYLAAAILLRIFGGPTI